MTDLRPDPAIPDPLTGHVNPLLNPLLEQNLSRWAEVYFTTPPERRDEAVRELLRQLHVEVDPSLATPAEPSIVEKPIAEPTFPTVSSPVPEPSLAFADEPSVASQTQSQSSFTDGDVVCSSCHSSNSPDQQFCGFCGSPLSRKPVPDAAAQSPEIPAYREARASSPAPQPAETLSFLGLNSYESDRVPDRESNTESNQDLQFLREKSFASDYYEPEPSHRGRFVVMAVLIALLALAYYKRPFVRSHLQAFFQSSPPATDKTVATDAQASPPVVTPTDSNSSGPVPAASAPVTPVPVEPAVKAPDKVAKGTTLKETDIAAGAAPEPAPEAPEPANTPKPLAQPLTLASRTEGSAAIPDGSQELLLAQRYLDGRGVPHDSAIAASWLWKAVGKQNARADMLLADLYVRGEGVSKSCDQARLLLVAATKKSAPGAAEKLRNFESSNCR